MNTYTFNTYIPADPPFRDRIDGVITVKVEFLTICSYPEKYDAFQLQDFNIEKYLHNLDGPSIINVTNGTERYAIEGKVYENKHEWKIASSKFKFDNKLEDILKE